VRVAGGGGKNTTAPFGGEKRDVMGGVRSIQEKEPMLEIKQRKRIAAEGGQGGGGAAASARRKEGGGNRRRVSPRGVGCRQGENVAAKTWEQKKKGRRALPPTLPGKTNAALKRARGAGKRGGNWRPAYCTPKEDSEPEGRGGK